MTRSRRADAVVAIVFAVAIALPGALHAAAALTGGGTDVLVRENRTMTSFPGLPGGAPARDYTVALEGWLADRFGLRAAMLSAYEGVQASLRLTGASDAVAVEGRDGWLFLGLSGSRREDHRAASALSLAVLEEWAIFAGGSRPRRRRAGRPRSR